MHLFVCFLSTHIALKKHTNKCIVLFFGGVCVGGVRPENYSHYNWFELALPFPLKCACSVRSATEHECTKKCAKRVFWKEVESDESP